MYRLLVSITLATAFLIGCGGGSPELEATQQVLDDYQQALADQDASAAVALVTPVTIDWYDEILAVAVEADADQLVDELPLSTAFLAMVARAEIGADLLTVSNGEELFERMVEAGAVDSTKFEIEEIVVDGDEAFGYIQGVRVLRFVQVEGAWRFDVAFVARNGFAALSAGDTPETRTESFELLAAEYDTSWSDLSQPLA